MNKDKPESILPISDINIPINLVALPSPYGFPTNNLNIPNSLNFYLTNNGNSAFSINSDILGLISLVMKSLNYFLIFSSSSEYS